MLSSWPTHSSTHLLLLLCALASSVLQKWNLKITLRFQIALGSIAIASAECTHLWTTGSVSSFLFFSPPSSLALAFTLPTAKWSSRWSSSSSTILQTSPTRTSTVAERAPWRTPPIRRLQASLNAGSASCSAWSICPSAIRKSAPSVKTVNCCHGYGVFW